MATFEGVMELLENGDPQAHQPSLEESVREDIRERLEKRNTLFRMKAVEEAIGPMVDQVRCMAQLMPQTTYQVMLLFCDCRLPIFQWQWIHPNERINRED